MLLPQKTWSNLVLHRWLFMVQNFEFITFGTNRWTECIHLVIFDIGPVDKVLRGGNVGCRIIKNIEMLGNGLEEGTRYEQLFFVDGHIIMADSNGNFIFEI